MPHLPNFESKTRVRRFIDSALALIGLSWLMHSPLAIGQAGSFVAFESGQVRPMAMSPNRQRLYVVNTPDNRLEIFDITQSGLTLAHSIAVGMEPVAVAARDNSEIWVVNHLSDSISIVRLAPDAAPPQVVRTLQVGDAPRDIVFAGEESGRAFITTAHRGQNSPVEFDPFNSIGRADVWVFDAADPSAPLTILTFFGDTPRALAKGPGGRRVYAAVLNSGNRSTTLSVSVVDNNMPPPLTNADGVLAPWTSLVAQFDGTRWLDGAGGDWTDKVEVSLPDRDVFVIDAMADPPQALATVTGVGTTLFNMAVNPVSAKIYVSNTEARNGVRFEGPGEFWDSTVRGHFVESRITVIEGTQVTPRHLNKHIDYDSFPGTPAENAASLATPLDMQVSSDGATLYVAAFGSDKVGVFDTAELESDDFSPDESSHIQLSGGGPTGLVLDEVRQRLYVLTRFDNAISVVDLTDDSELQHVAMHNPEPLSIVDGRRFLYDASYTSSRGDSSCAGCHIFGDTDHLAWDLGDPDGSVTPNPNPPNAADPPPIPFHPMKGPMTTQSLRGISTHGPMHWRGDRTGGNDPGGDPMDEEAAFKAFNGAFEGLVGRETKLTDLEMQAFTDFALQIAYPPNPIRALDNSLNQAETRGETLFLNGKPDHEAVCVDCHAFDPALGLFGSSGTNGIVFASTDAMQAMKVPHLRNVYTKVGFLRASNPEIRGFGFLNDGAMDTLLRFFQSFDVFEDGPIGAQERRDVSSFLFTFDAGLAPIVGQQVTLGAGDPSAAGRVTLLRTRAGLGECDLIAKGVVQGRESGFLMEPSGQFRTDRAADPLMTLSEIVAAGQALTFTCAPPGSGIRMGLDRDEDGVLDGDEVGA